MSVLKMLALSAAAGLALTASAQAQVSRPDAGTVTAAGRTTTTARPVDVAPGRPTVIDRRGVRPHRGDRGDRGYDHLRERLRNACFNDPNPPAPLCRRVFGDHDGGRGG